MAIGDMWTRVATLVFKKFGTLTDIDFLMTCALPYWNQKLIRNVNGRHLENIDDVIITPPIHMKFGVPTQNEMPMTTGRLKSKPEVEFQYGGRSFYKTGSSYNSAVD